MPGLPFAVGGPSLKLNRGRSLVCSSVLAKTSFSRQNSSNSFSSAGPLYRPCTSLKPKTLSPKRQRPERTMCARGEINISRYHPASRLPHDNHLLDQKTRHPSRGSFGCVYFAMGLLFGQRLRSDIQRFPGPGLTPSPGRSCLKVRLLVSFNVLGGTLTLPFGNNKRLVEL